MPIHAGGRRWKQDRRARAAAHRALSPSKRAEARYVLDLQRILGRVHAGVLHVVHREHLGTDPPDAELRHDSEAPRVGLGDELLRRIMRYVRPQAQLSFDFMAHEVNKGSARATELVGVRPRMVPGLATTIDQARQRNVSLITGASEDFLRQVRQVLADNEGARHEHIAKLLEERVGVSMSRAQLIARDQTSKLNAALNEHRQRAAGVTSFRWSTSKDERVRASHRELDGQIFSWDDPPVVDDEEATPGDPVNCRCIAIPVLEETEEPDEPETKSGGKEEEEPEPPPAEEPRASLEDLGIASNLDREGKKITEDAIARGGFRRYLERQPVRSIDRLRSVIANGVYSRAATPGPGAPLSKIALNSRASFAESFARTQRKWQRLGGAAELGSADLHTVSSLGESAEAMRERTAVHELGHHLHLNPRDQLPEHISEAIDDAYNARVGLGKTVNPGRWVVSNYGRSDQYEWWAETHSAYVYHPEILRAKDPEAFALVQRVRQHRGLR